MVLVASHQPLLLAAYIAFLQMLNVICHNVHEEMKPDGL